MQQQALAELTSRLKRAEQRWSRLETELQQEKRSGRGLALQCRQAAMQMHRLQVRAYVGGLGGGRGGAHGL